MSFVLIILEKDLAQLLLLNFTLLVLEVHLRAPPLNIHLDEFVDVSLCQVRLVVISPLVSNLRGILVGGNMLVECLYLLSLLLQLLVLYARVHLAAIIPHRMLLKHGCLLSGLERGWRERLVDLVSNVIGCRVSVSLVL